MVEKIEAKKILFISFDHIGDIVRFTPFLINLRHLYPKAFISLLIPPLMKDLFKKSPYLDEVITFSHKSLKDKLLQGGKIEKIVFDDVHFFLASLKQVGYDLVINPYSDIGAIITSVIKPKNVLGRVMTSWNKYRMYGKEATEFYYCMNRTNELRVYSENNFVETTLKLLLDLGVTKNDILCKIPKLYLTKAESLFAQKFFKENGLLNKFVLGVQFAAKDNKKMWPLEKLVLLLNRLSAELSIKIILFGDKKDLELTESEILPELNFSPIIAAGKTNLLELTALMEKVNLLLSVDSGPMHIAAARATPIIGLFAKRAIIIRESIPVGAPSKIIEKNYISEIEVEEVFCVIKQSLNDFSKSLN